MIVKNSVYAGLGEKKMKRALQLLLAMSFTAMFLISPVAAATSQGLEWGFAVDDEYTFQMEFVEENVVSFSEGVNVTVTGAPAAIDDPLLNWSDFDYPTLNMTFYNGTSIGLLAFLFLGMVTVGGAFAVPIGNYSFLTTLAMSEFFWTENHTIIDNAQYWGIVYSGESSGMESSITNEYLKADGLLSRYVIDMTNTTSSTTTSVSFLRDIPGGPGFDIVGFITDNILYIGIGLGVLIVLAIVCKKR